MTEIHYSTHDYDLLNFIESDKQKALLIMPSFRRGQSFVEEFLHDNREFLNTEKIEISQRKGIDKNEIYFNNKLLIVTYAADTYRFRGYKTDILFFNNADEIDPHIVKEIATYISMPTTGYKKQKPLRFWKTKDEEMQETLSNILKDRVTDYVDIVWGPDLDIEIIED